MITRNEESRTQHRRSTLLKNATCISLSPPAIEHVDLRIRNGVVAERAASLRALPREEVVDLSGRIIMPGMVNAHTHLYSALARGMTGPKRSPVNFLEILKSIWWKLDRTLDEESIHYSALAGCIDAIRSGTTTLVDHHSSPNSIDKSLDNIADAMLRVGVRGILCYETTDRGGRKRRDKGLDENERFVERHQNHPWLRGTIGAHASFTLGNDTLDELATRAHSHDCGIHIHVAEDRADVLNATSIHHTTIARRLHNVGLLMPRTILAHGVHLSPAEFRLINAQQAWLVHNPRSNMNNAVGYAPLTRFGANAALGTDGFPADMFEECAMGFFRNRESQYKTGFSRMPEMLHAGQRLVSDFFGREIGTLRPGSAADLIVLEYIPPTPLTAANLAGHFLFGMKSGTVRSVMVNGEWSMLNGDISGIDETVVMGEAAAVARRLWKRLSR